MYLPTGLLLSRCEVDAEIFQWQHTGRGICQVDAGQFDMSWKIELSSAVMQLIE